MSEDVPRATKSADEIAFGLWLRTGRRLSADLAISLSEHKFNPYHDPRDGRFTFAPGRGSLPPRVYRTRANRLPTNSQAPSRPGDSPARSDAVPTLIEANFTRNPRVRIGGNNGPPLNDPMTLEHVFPRTTGSPGAPIVALADNILDLSGPAVRLTSDITAAYTDHGTSFRQMEFRLRKTALSE